MANRWEVGAPALLTVNEPPTGWPAPGLGEVHQYRELLYFFTWRDVKVRYKQTALGAAWAILQPVLAMVIFTLIFGRLARLDSDGVPYPLFAYAALVPWTFFSNAVTQGANSLVQNERIITKIYFPRLILPMASVVAVLVDLALSAVVLVGLMLWYGVAPGVAALTLPLFVLLAAVTACGVGFFLSAVNVRYRDVRYFLPFLVQLWLFVTPVVYSADLVPPGWQFVYGLNPMVGAVEGFRWALLGTDGLDLGALASSVVTSTVILLVGLVTFRRMEITFADEV
ncbi:MAG TPA: ABC transporter permease [Acidimicrobiales bacterium]